MDKLEKLKKITLKAQFLEKTGQLGMAKEFLSIEDKIDTVKESVQTISEELKKKLEEELVYEVDEQKIVESVLSKVIIPEPIKGEQGIQGIPGKKGDTTIVEKVVEKIIEKTEVIREIPIVTNEVKEVAIPETAEEIVSKLESLEGEERLDASAIKNLPEILNENNQTLAKGRLVSVAVDGTTITGDGTLANPLIAVTGAATDEKVKYDAADASAGYLGAKTAAGTGISLAEGTGGNADKLVITNSAPDQTVAITAGTNITSVTGTYPNFTINAATQGTLVASDLYKLDNFSGNGVRNGFTITINADTTKIDIAAGVGYIIDNTTDPAVPVRTVVTYAGQTAIVLTNLATSVITYLAVNSSGTVIQQTTPFTPTQRRTHIIIGAAIHSNLTVVNAINNLPDVVIDSSDQFNDFLDSLTNFNASGNIMSANGANLNINKSLGSIFKKGSNFNNDTKNPHLIATAALVAPTNIRYRLQNGTEYANTAVIDPNNYDLAGVLTATPVGKYTVQRITLFTSNLIRIQYGQNLYNTLSAAQQAISTETFVVENNIAANGLLRGVLIVKKGTTALNTAADALFIEASKFGDTTSLTSAGGTTTLQQAYDNGVEPEILTNTTKGAVSIKRGTAADTDNIFEGINGAGAVTFSITGAGVVAGSNLSGTNTGDDAVNTLYSGLVTNATHTGEVTGSGALTIDKTAITGKTTVTGVGTDYILISDTSDTGNLKKVLASDFMGGGSAAPSGQASINFGAITQEDSIATVTVNTASALTTSIIMVSPAGVATADHDPDDYQWDNISGYVTNIINGVSFDIIGVAPNGSWGSYLFNYVIN